MKSSDFRQAEQILRMIDKLTAEECSSVEIHADNAEGAGKNDCCITAKDFAGIDEIRCHGPNINACLEQAIRFRRLVVDEPEEMRLYRAAGAIVKLMQHLWSVRAGFIVAGELGAIPEETVRAQSIEIRTEMLYAEDALKPILERLAGYCWDDLPKDIQQSCQAAGVMGPDVWAK